MSITFWRNWLIAVMVGVIGYALGLIAAPQIMHTFFNALFFGSSDEIQQMADHAHGFIPFVYGVLGAVLIGWMSALLTLLVSAFTQGTRYVWNTISVSILTWFVIDSGFSLYSGLIAHAIFNCVFLVLFAVPLAAIYRRIRTTIDHPVQVRG